MQKSTNKLTKHELHFAETKAYPKMKQAISEKIGNQFAQLGNQLIEKVELGNFSTPNEFKITKGENCALMPYLVLDYPKIAGTDFDIVYRTLFWWGHYFSLNIIIKQSLLQTNWINEIATIKKLRILVSDNIWQNDMSKIPYYPVSKIIDNTERKAQLETLEHIRVSTVIKLRHQSSLNDTALDFYNGLTKKLNLI